MKKVQKNILIKICLPALIFLSTTPALKAADVKLYAVYKRQIFVQTGASTAPLTNMPDIFNAVVELTSPASAKPATLTCATNPPIPLGRWNENEFLPRWWIDGDCEIFPSQAAMDAARPDGNYTFSIPAAHDGQKTLTLSLAGDSYPPTPFIKNWASAQSVDATKNFKVQWDAYVGGTTSDFIFVSVRGRTNGDVLFSTQFLQTPGHLNGTATSVVIPAGTLQPGQQYDAYVRFDKITVRDTTSYPGAVGSAGYARGTHFSLVTLPGPAATPSIVNSLTALSPIGKPALVNGIFHGDLAVKNGTSFRIEESTNLVDWSVVCTNIANGNTVHFDDPDTGSSGMRYYRAVPVDAP